MKTETVAAETAELVKNHIGLKINSQAIREICSVNGTVSYTARCNSFIVTQMVTCTSSWCVTI